MSKKKEETPNFSGAKTRMFSEYGNTDSATIKASKDKSKAKKNSD
jgi:hypothetical protein